MPSYPEDEFDAAASDRAPLGVHRRRRSVLVAILTPLLIFIGAGVLALGVVAYMWAADGGTGLPPLRDVASPTITETVVETPTDDAAAPTPTPTPSETPSVTPTPTETAEPVQFGANVVVLNGAKISGLAATNADKLTAGGFTAVTAGNISTSLPAANTVRYSDDMYATTAQQVAALLGIAAVEQGVTPEGNISVILVAKTAS